MKYALLCLLLLTACASDPEPTALLPDPERAAEDFLKNHIFDAPRTLRDRFSPGLDPSEFPLRLIVDGPEQYRYLGLYRTRTIDGRVVIDALVELLGESYAFQIWLETDGTVWRIAGWAATPLPVDAQAPAPPAGVQMPKPLAPATFRGTPPVRTVPVLDVAAELAADAPDTSKVAVHVKTLGYSGKCPRSRLKRLIRRQKSAFGRCYKKAIGRSGRRGRLTIKIIFEAGQKPDAYLIETTLLNTALSDCLVGALSTLPPTADRGEPCEVTVPITFKPQ